MFKENVRLNEALKYHIKEAQQLQKLTASLEKEKTSLALDKVCLKDGTANRGVTGSLWIESIHLHTKKSHFQTFSPPPVTLVRAVQDIFQVPPPAPCVIYLC